MNKTAAEGNHPEVAVEGIQTSNYGGTDLIEDCFEFIESSKQRKNMIPTRYPV